MVADGLRNATALDAIEERLTALDAREIGAVDDSGARAAIRDVGADLHLLRDSLRMELLVVDAELERLAEIIDDVAGGVGGADPSGPLSEEEEPRWVVLSADHEPGVRFSALVRLGRTRTDRSVQASLARLEDVDPSVVWQALRNLASFRERAAAAVVVPLLEHDSAAVRGAALDALLRLGAPADSGYDPVGPIQERNAAAAVLQRWADE